MFIPLLSQMCILLGLVLVGFILSKAKLIPDNSAQVLSRLETLIFVPCLAMGTFIANCTIERLSQSWQLLLCSVLLFIILLPTSFLIAKLLFKSKYLQNIATYGLIFSNFGFMGNAIMLALYKDIFFDYILFVMPFWFTIYAWAVPFLLLSGGSTKSGIKSSFKNMLNPMFIGMIIGAIIGLLNITPYIPTQINSIIEILSDCMSPIAMLLTGMTIGKLKVLNLLKKYKLYIMTFIRLLLLPAIFLLIVWAFNLNEQLNLTILLCITCFLSMPFGLNTIIIPASLQKDTSDAAGMALISNICCIGTIPLIFELLYLII